VASAEGVSEGGLAAILERTERDQAKREVAEFYGEAPPALTTEPTTFALTGAKAPRLDWLVQDRLARRTVHIASGDTGAMKTTYREAWRRAGPNSAR
jgi:hypothetical protein